MKKEEDDSPGFWDQKEGSPVTESKKEEYESPGFWDQQADDEKKEEQDVTEGTAAENVETKPIDEEKEEEEESEEDEEQDDDESRPDIAELKDVAQKLVCVSGLSLRC